MKDGRRIRLTRDIWASDVLRRLAVPLEAGTEADLIPHIDEDHGRSQSRLRLDDGRELLANVLGACEVIPSAAQEGGGE